MQGSVGRRPLALVVGGGIAGPVAAMALQRAGVDAVVYDARAEDAEDDGSFLNLASNGLDALKSIGAHGGPLVEGVRTPWMAIWSGSGKQLGVIPNGLTLKDGTTSLTIPRAVLRRALR